MRRTILCVLLAALMMSAVSGCGDSGNEENDLDGVTEEVNEASEKLVEEVATVTEIDPFEGLEVTFEGIAPYSSSVLLDGTNSNVEYTLSAEENISNGDVITITATLSSNSSDYRLTETEKEYTVEGLDSYVVSIDDIPTEAYDKMLNQANDGITAYGAELGENASIASSEPLGAYLLSVKTSNSESYDENLNVIYLVYKITTNVKGYKLDGGETEENVQETFYTYYEFKDIMILADGSCSLDLGNGELCKNVIDSDYIWGFDCYRYYGYSDLDSMFNNCVTAQIEDYNYESTVTE